MQSGTVDDYLTWKKQIEAKPALGLTPGATPLYSATGERVEGTGAPLVKETTETRIGDYIVANDRRTLVPNSRTDINLRNIVVSGGYKSSGTPQIFAPLAVGTAGAALGGAAKGVPLGGSLAAAGAGAASAALATALPIIAATAITYPSKLKALEEARKKEEVLYNTAVDFYKDTDGELKAKIDYSKMSGAGELSSPEVIGLQERETAASIGDDGRLKVSVAPSFASTNYYKQLMDEIGTDYAGLTKDSAEYEDAIKNIVQRIDGAKNQYLANAISYQAYKAKFSNASDAAIIAGYTSAAAGNADPEDMEDYDMAVVENGEITSKTAKEYFDAVYSMNKDERNDLLRDLQETVLGKKENVDDDLKAVAYGDYQALIAVSENKYEYKDDKYQGMLDADAAVSFFNQFMVLDDLLLGGKQEYLRQNELASIAGAITSTAGLTFGAAVGMKASGAILQRAPGMSRVFAASLEGRPGGAAAFLLQAGRDDASAIAKAAGASFVFNSMKSALFNAAIAGLQFIGGEKPEKVFGVFLHNFTFDLALGAFMEYYDAVKFQSKVVDSKSYVYVDKATGNLKILDVADGKAPETIIDLSDDGLQTEYNYAFERSVAQTPAGDTIAYATDGSTEVVVVNNQISIDTKNAPANDPAFKTGTVNEADAGVANDPAFKTGTVNEADADVATEAGIKDALVRAGLPETTEVVEIPTKDAMSAVAAGKFVRPESSKIGLGVSKRLFNSNAVIDVVNNMALAKTGDRTAWQNLAEAGASVQASASNIKMDILAGKYHKPIVESHKKYIDTYGNFRKQFGRMTKADNLYIKAKESIARATLNKEATKGETRDYVAEAMEKNGKYLAGVSEERAAALDTYVHAAKSFLADYVISVRKTGQVDDERMENVIDTDISREIGYIPMWGKKETYNGLLDRFYGISQERAPIKDWIRDGEVVDVKDIEDFSVSINRFMDFFATNLALNERNALLTNQLEAANLLVDNTPSSSTIRKNKLSAISNKKHLVNRFKKSVSEAKKFVEENVPSQGEWVEMLNKIYGKHGIEGLVQRLSRESGPSSKIKSLQRQLETAQKELSSLSEVDGSQYASPTKFGRHSNPAGYIKFKEEQLVPSEEVGSLGELLAFGMVFPGGWVDSTNHDIRELGQKFSVDDLIAISMQNIGDPFSAVPQIARFYGFEDDEIYSHDWTNDEKATAKKVLENGNYRLKNDTVLYKGVSEGGNQINKTAKPLPWSGGDGSYSDNGYNFVTLDEDAARRYFGGENGEKYILRFHIPKGQGVFYFGDVGRGTNDGGALVLPPLKNLTAIHAGKTTDGVATYIDIYCSKDSSGKVPAAVRASRAQARINKETKLQQETINNIKESLIVESGKALAEAAGYNEQFGKHIDLDAYLPGFEQKLYDAIKTGDSDDIRSVIALALTEVAPYTTKSSVLKTRLDGVASEWRKWAKKNIKIDNEKWSKWADENHLDDKSLERDEAIDLVAQEINGTTPDSAEMGTAKKAAGMGGRYPITYYKNGKPYTRWIKYATEQQQRIAEEIEAVLNDRQLLRQPGIVTRVARSFANNFRLLTTGFDPSRTLPNLARDTGRGEVSSGGVSFTTKGAKAIFQVLLEEGDYTDEQKVKLKQAFELAAKKAGENTYNAAYRTPGRAENELYREYLNSGKDNEKNPLVRFSYDLKILGFDLLHSPTKILEAPGNFVEGYTRKRMAYSNFIATLREKQLQGASFENQLEAAAAAANFAGNEYTANFFRKGAAVGRISQYVAYFSTSFADAASFKNAFINDPVGVSRNFAMFLVAYMILLADSLSNDETRKNYYRLTDYDRSNSVIVSLGGNTMLTIPMDDTLAGMVFPFRKMMEALYNADPGSFYAFVWGTLTEPLPVDLSGFSEGDYFNIKRGLEKLASSGLPTWAAGVYETVTGYDLYYGTSREVSRQDLLQRGIYDPQPGDFTTQSSNSAVLREIANATGIPQWQLQVMLSNYGGNVGQYVLNTVDKLVGATEDAQGGKEFKDAIFKSFVAVDSDTASSQFYDGITKLREEKRTLLQKLSNINEKMKTATGDDLYKLQSQYQQTKDDYATKVSDYVRQYLNAYDIAGGLSKSQAMQIYYLFRLDEDVSVYESGSVGEYYNNLATQQSAQEATSSAAPVLDTFYNQYDRLYKDSSGTWRLAPTYGEQAYYNTLYGQGVQHEVNLRNLIDNGSNSLSAARTEAYAKRNAAYASGDWDAYDKAGYDFDSLVIQRIAPYINRYGAENILTNSTVLDYLEEWIIVPSNWMKTKYGRSVSLSHNASKNRVFARPYLKYLFGLDTGATSNYNENKAKLTLGDFE